MPALREWNINPNLLPPGWTLAITPEPPSSQGWYDPNTGQSQRPNHSNYFRYVVTIPANETLYQIEGTIYWLDISVQSVEGQWGWKTSRSPHFMDDAVWADLPVGNTNQWNELRDPVEDQVSLDLAFIINGGGEEPEQYDFGDAPDGAAGTGTGDYQTRQADGGAYHTIVAGAPYFDDGTMTDQPDAEADGQQTANADGDDLNPPLVGDDEDGIVITVLIAGLPGTVTVNVPVGGYVNAWIDFNADGDWTDPGEQIQSGWLAAGVYNIGFNVPAWGQRWTDFWPLPHPLRNGCAAAHGGSSGW